jgi:hypothetical protein
MANNPYLMVRSRSEYYRQKKKFSPTLRNIYKKQHGARLCVEKMQLIFYVPPNEELRDLYIT